MKTIGQLAKAFDINVETVRYYQRKGILDVPASQGSIRRYGKKEHERLRFIKNAKHAGFTLDEIKQLIELDQTDDREKVRVLAKHRMHSLEKQITALQAAHRALQRLANECSNTNQGPCPILDAFSH